MEKLRVGPSLIFLGNPVTAGGADMDFIGKTRGDVTITPNVEVAVGRTDQTGVTPLGSAVKFSGIAPVVSIPLLDEEKAKLQKIFIGSSLQTQNLLEAIGFGSGFKHISKSQLFTLCILPIRAVADYAGTNGNEDPDAFWFPLVVAREYGQFTFNLPEGDDILNPRETQFAGLYTEEDQGATAIPQDSRVMFQGPPNASGLTWNLPDLSTIL